MTNKEIVECLADLQKQYAEAFRKAKYNLCGVDDRCVHVRDELFFDVFDSDSITKELHDKHYKYQYSAEYNGTKFICLSDREDINEKQI